MLRHKNYHQTSHLLTISCRVSHRVEFIRYRLEDALIEGEEIDKRTIERFLPAAELSGKTVLIYGDGHFCGNEVKHLRERAKAIGAKFILVECIKSQIPRLYNF